MPPVSQAQRSAMYAAKEGHSTLGIPQKVGAEFVAADTGGKLPARADSHRRLKAAMMASSAPPPPRPQPMFGGRGGVGPSGNLRP